MILYKIGVPSDWKIIRAARVKHICWGCEIPFGEDAWMTGYGKNCSRVIQPGDSYVTRPDRRSRNTIWSVCEHCIEEAHQEYFTVEKTAPLDEQMLLVSEALKKAVEDLEKSERSEAEISPDGSHWVHSSYVGWRLLHPEDCGPHCFIEEWLEGQKASLRFLAGYHQVRHQDGKVSFTYVGYKITDSYPESEER